MTNLHSRFMQRALSLAQKGKGKVHPNPMVGCVLVKNGRIIAEGFHSRYGGPHAEIQAIQKAGRKTKGSTLYINLEPCAHWGKTPPCAPALLKAGIKEVFVSIKDPNPEVNGKGLNILKKGKVRLHVGLEKEAATLQNRSFITWKSKNRPYTILKMAVTLDGKIATRTGDSKWISSPASRNLVHQMRGESDAVLIGANTANLDNPLLTSHGTGRNPIRIVLDPHLKTKSSLKLYTDKTASTVIITSPKGSLSKQILLQKKGVQILRVGLKYGSIEMRKLLRVLSENNISQLFIEGGGETAWQAISQKIVDEVLLFVAPVIAGGRDAKTSVEGLGVGSIRKAFALKSLTVGRIGPDILIKGLLK